MSDIYTVIPYGRKWAVKRPDGTLRCVVQAKNLAKEIAKQCSLEMADKNPKVRCVETGKIYSSSQEAANSAGLHKSSITRSITTGKKTAGYHWERVIEPNWVMDEEDEKCC